MKRQSKWAFYITPMLAAAVMISAACRKQDNAPREILTSFYPVQIFTMNITAGIDPLRPRLLLPAGLGCPHDYSLTPGDVEALSSAKIIIINGGIESFITAEKMKAVNPALVIIDSGAGISGGTLPRDGSGNEYHKNRNHESSNPHTWVSPFRASEQARSIGAALAEFYPQYKKKLMENTESYAGRLVALGEKMKSELSEIKNKKIITFHDAFEFFAKDLGLEIAGVIEAEPGISPGPRRIAELIELAKENKLRVIFAESQYPDDVARTIAAEAGLRVVSIDPAASGESESPGAYEDIMINNLKLIKGAQ